ncbi:MAG: ABC transporter ATP-binding protein [Solobacterium sp.]|nr:ABC transporter ATP-binding protein [Solobacterium sp.]
MTYLSADHITYGYQNTPVLKDVSFSAEKGTCVCICGPSGVGKTTLLKVVAGLLKPESGTVLLEGTDITGSLPSERRMAMIFQNAALFPHTRVRHNIAYGLHKLGYTEDEIDRMVNETAQLLHIETQLNKYPGALSGGQLQRAGIARAIVRRPEILLLDEPFSSLDKPLRAELIQELDRIRRDRGMTMIYVTHDVDEIRDYADSIVELRPAVEHLVSDQ